MSVGEGNAISTVTLTLTSGDAPAIREEGAGLVERAQSMVIESSSTYAEAAFMLVGLAALVKRVKDHHGPMKTAANKAHKAIVAAEAELVTPMEQARSLLMEKRMAWEATERNRMAVISARMTEEAQSQADEEAEVFGGPVAVVAPVAVAAVLPEVSGVSKRRRWVAVLEDKAAFVAYALDRHKAGDSRFLDLIEVAMTDLHAQARVDRSGMRVPGVRAEEVVTEAVRG